jgi:hypothetical protein
VGNLCPRDLVDDTNARPCDLDLPPARVVRSSATEGDMYERFQCVGVVKKVRAGDCHVVGEVPGKVALVIEDPDAGGCLGYFPRDRRPKVGARVGARGAFVEIEVPLERLSPEEREALCGGTPVQFQLDVTEWSVVDDDYDPLFD